MPKRTCDLDSFWPPRKMRRFWGLSLLLAGLLIGWAAPPPDLAYADSAANSSTSGKVSDGKAVSLNSEQAKQLARTLDDPEKRKELVATLTALAATQQKTAEQQPQKIGTLVDTTTRNISNFSNEIVTRLHVIPRTISNFRAFGHWVEDVWETPSLQKEIGRVCLRVALLIIGGTILSYLVHLVLIKLRKKLEASARTHDSKAIRDAIKAMQDDKAHQDATLSELKHTQDTDDKISNDVSMADKASSDASTGTDQEGGFQSTGSQDASPKGIVANSDKKTKTDDNMTQGDIETVQRDALYRRGKLAHFFIVLRRLPYTLGCFCLDLIGTMMFPIVALLIQSFDPSPDANILRAVWGITWIANVSFGVWMAFLRAFLAPQHPWLRLSMLRDQTTDFLFRWLSRIGNVIAWGAMFLIILRNCTLPAPVLSALIKLLMLCVHIMIALMILQGRSYVKAALVREEKGHKRFNALFEIFVKCWWIAALFFDLAIWLVWAADIRDGYRIIWHVFARTCIALFIVRTISILLYGGLERAFHILSDLNVNHDTKIRILRYYPAIKRICSIFLVFFTIFALGLAWGAPVYSLVGHRTVGALLLSSFTTIVIALLIGVIIWEAANMAIESNIRRLEKEHDANFKARAARVRTLQPMLRILLLVILGIIVGLTILSQLGVNTAPLLAGASIFGVAIGFGSQKLVQDFISGIFLLLENALTVGDAVTLNGTYGVVETLSLRTVHVRANDGSMNIFPFSSLGQIINYNRDFARAIILAEVSYDTDTDDAVQALYDITKTMREDKTFGPMIIDDLNIWGVDSLNDSSVTIKGTLPTTTAGRWPVQRQFNRRMKKVFQERGIGIPFPTRTLDIPDFDKLLERNSQKESLSKQSPTEKGA